MSPTHPFLKRFAYVFRICFVLFQSLEKSAAKYDKKTFIKLRGKLRFISDS